MLTVAIDRIDPVLDEDGNQTGYGEGPRWTGDYYFEGRVLDGDDNVRAGSYAYFKAGFKKPPSAGDTETFESKIKKDGSGPTVFPDGKTPDGKTKWRCVVGRPKQDNYGGGNRGGAGRSFTPSKPASGPANAPQAHPKPVPTMTEAVTALGEIDSLLEGTPEQVTTCFIAWQDTGLPPAGIVAAMKECIAAVERPEHAICLFLGRIKGKIRRDLSPEDLAKAQAEKDAKAAREQAVKDGATPTDIAVGDGQMAAGDFASARDTFVAVGAKALALATMQDRPVGTNDGSDDIPF